MALDIAKFRSWARIPHTEDDPAIGIAWAAAVRELEERTGWCVESVTRTQWVASAPLTIYGGLYLKLDRQGDLAGTTVGYSDSAAVPLTGSPMDKIQINGLIYVDMDITSLTYPVTLTVTAGNAALNPLLEMALLQRVAHHVASRGDDTVALDSTYWDRITGMMGKGIA
tara:strand:+ start:1277 stop:1783 length:507 start_codon:yes stop_codon:yes gene_type:complete